MKKFLLTLAALSLAVAGLAGTYSITTNANQDQRLEKERVRQNKFSCQAAGRPADCTQTQCRQTNPDCEIYTSISDLIDRKILGDYLDQLKNKDTQDDQVQFCTWWAGASVANRNSVCATSGLPNGCELCQ